MLSKIFFLLFTIFPFISFAQKDTTYLKGHRKVFTREEADSYRLPYIPEGERYKVLDYYKSGSIKIEGYSRTFDSLIWDGPYTAYHENGNVKVKGVYANGHRIANWKGYRENGKLLVLSSFNLNSDTTEILRSFYESGKVKRIEYIAAGSMLEGRKDSTIGGVCYAEDGTEIPFTPFEKMPEFKGDVNRFLAMNIRYPADAQDGGYEGRVFVQFIVMEDGTVADPVVINPSIHPSLMLETLRVVKTMNGKWKPALMDDEKVKCYFTLPVLFKLQ